MSLICVFLSIITEWRPAFTKNQTFLRAREHAFAALCCLGRKTITNYIIFRGKDQQDHSADYYLYSFRKWSVNSLFNPILKRSLGFFTGKYIVVGADDTLLRKTGKKIPGSSWKRDPLGPPFQANLVWALRYLQFSLLVPVYLFSDKVMSCRAIPIRFICAPSLKKPKQSAREEEWKAYQQASPKSTLSYYFVEGVKQLRGVLDQMGMSAKTLLMVVDGSFCNERCLAACVPGVEILGRLKKNARLCMKASGQGSRFYSKATFTPEEFRRANQKDYKRGLFRFGGAMRRVRYTEIKNVYWRTVTRRRPLRLIVIAPMPYVRGGKRFYRDPAYLLCTDLDADLEFLIQSYLDRWQIEVNFRDLKSLMGVGEAQVWSEKSVERQPAFVVACYAALHLAGILCYGDTYHEGMGVEPIWRKPPKRLNIRFLRGQLREELIKDPGLIQHCEFSPAEIAGILRMAA